MKLYKTFAVTALIFCMATNYGTTAQAQVAQNWKTYKQLFSNPKFPAEMQNYQHQVTLGNGKFITRFSRDFGVTGLFTGVVTANLADIDVPNIKVVKGRERYVPEYWYVHVPIKNPRKAPSRVLATPQTDRTNLIVKDQTSIVNGKKTIETWILTQMYLNFDNETAARQAVADIAKTVG